ncbi:DUF411 domain-containing protein [Albimonas sp. CAU 1670]|uniref:DUF411 domain-containing protein n=1 Tax=Albimonas sp. CAU 1670 TaxID=3032599 RepID=UPI0023DB59F9|nr:DUF411 domain-containing protein [Albimonas sp. CAU 1670]MDF2234190.1 DUF411 domain-containing protein [Albimonas sp. CAU 1670]
MTRFDPARRTLLLAAAASAFVAAAPRARAAAAPALHVMKDPGCGCCSAWVEVMQDAGFEVTTEEMGNALLVQRKIVLGIPQQAASCHTGVIEGYVVEGHVPPADVRRLLAERPDAVGIATPGMPYGSPGMGPESEREAYDVVLIGRDGALSLWSRYDAA